MRIKNPDERTLYELEAANQKWSVDDLKRRYNSNLYERLVISPNKHEILRLAKERHTVEKPKDILKNPFVLKFPGMEEMAVYSESDLETAITSKLQNFLLEAGKSFLFVARHPPLLFDEESFWIVLVFYNRLLQCYVLIINSDGLLVKAKDATKKEDVSNFFKLVFIKS
jgi:predicted nuclease of restriction endonuclease-like (RecB) superfamily